MSLGIQSQLDSVAGKVPPYLELCVVDGDHLATRRRLAGRAGCDLADAAFVQERPLAFAGRQWDVRVAAMPQDTPNARDARTSGLFALVGLISAAMLGASLLITTGRTRRIESAVRERTAALQRRGR